MKGIYKFLGVSKIGGWFPAIVSNKVALPFDQVLVLVSILTTVKNLFNFIFKVIFNLYWFWWWGGVAVNIIVLPRREMVNVENGMLMH